MFNERPTREEQTVAVPAEEKKRPSAKRCTIHTTKGDISVQLFPDEAPKTVENFITHARNGALHPILVLILLLNWYTKRTPRLLQRNNLSSYYQEIREYIVA